MLFWNAASFNKDTKICKQPIPEYYVFKENSIAIEEHQSELEDLPGLLKILMPFTFGSNLNLFA